LVTGLMRQIFNIEKNVYIRLGVTLKCLAKGGLVLVIQWIKLGNSQSKQEEGENIISEK
jgi:ATP:corrinoid adenosyltransferase